MTSLTRTKFNHIVMNDIWALGFLITYKPVSIFSPFVVFLKAESLSLDSTGGGGKQKLTRKAKRIAFFLGMFVFGLYIRGCLKIIVCWVCAYFLSRGVEKEEEGRSDVTLRMSIEDHSSGIERSAAALGHRVGLRSMSAYTSPLLNQEILT